MPADVHGDDADPREPTGGDSGHDPDAAEPAPVVGREADPDAPVPAPAVGAGGSEGDEITAPLPTAADEDTGELWPAPTAVGPPPIPEEAEPGPVDRARRTRRRALIATLVAAILALVGLGAAILVTDDEPGDGRTSTSSSSTTDSTAPSTTEGLTPGPVPGATTSTTAGDVTTTAPSTTTTQATTTTAPTTTSTTTTTTSTTTTSTTTSTTASSGGPADRAASTTLPG